MRAKEIFAKTKRDVRIAGLLMLCLIPILFALHPVIGIRDLDAEAYIAGARALHHGDGYRWGDEPLNHFPPGYSWMLSHFANHARAGQIINYVSFGACGGLLFLLARFSGWPLVPALGMAMAIALAFFRVLASNLAPDVPTYAAFFAAALLLKAGGRWAWAAFVILSLLPLLKYAALLFLPSALWERWRLDGFQPRFPWRLILASSLWLITIAPLFAWNYSLYGDFLAPTFFPATLKSVALAPVGYAWTFLRTVISNWYGSIRSLSGWLPWSLPVVAGLLCLSTLRLRDRGARAPYLGFGVAILLGSSLPCLFRFVSTRWRLLGYGSFLILVSFIPEGKRTEKWWLGWAFVAMLTAIINVATVETAGANHPEYARVMSEIAASPPSGKLFTNAKTLFRTHSRLVCAHSPGGFALAPGDIYVAIELPNHDGIKYVREYKKGPNWCLERKYDGATVYKACP